MLMSFLGAIGHLMAALGLQEMLELIYASSAVAHMLTGKAVARAVQGHLLVDAALNALVIASTFDAPIPACGKEIEKLWILKSQLWKVYIVEFQLLKCILNSTSYLQEDVQENPLQNLKHQL